MRQFLGVMLFFLLLACPPAALGEVIGTSLWSKSLNKGYGHDYLPGVSFDPNGNPVYVGQYKAAGAASNYDAHAMILTPDGETIVWETTIAGVSDSTDRFSAVHFDQGGNMYLAGYASGTYPPYVTAQVLRKYDPARNLLWERRHYAEAWNSVQSVKTDGDGNVYTAGHEFYSWSSIQYQWTILKYSPEGSLFSGFPIRYNYSPSIDAPDVATALAIDMDGNMYAGGYLGMMPSKMQDWHLRKYNPDRVLQWTDTINGPGASSDVLLGLALDGHGHVYACGRKWTGTQQVWLVIRYDCTPPGGGTAAYRRWERTYASEAATKDGTANAIAIAPDGALYVAGWFADENGIQQATILQLDPPNGLVLARDASDRTTSSQVMALAFRADKMAWSGILHNGTDWDYLYGMIQLPPPAYRETLSLN